MRGNLEEIKKNFSNTERHLNGTKNTHITKQPIIQPKKDIIQLIETENAKSKAEANEFLEKFKAVTSLKNNENDQITKRANLIEKDNRECIIEEEEEEIRTVPPKPLPRKSISEQSSTEEFPKPRPRATAGNNYKVSCFSAHIVGIYQLLVVDLYFILPARVRFLLFCTIDETYCVDLFIIHVGIHEQFFDA